MHTQLVGSGVSVEFADGDRARLTRSRLRMQRFGSAWAGLSLIRSRRGDLAYATMAGSFADGDRVRASRSPCDLFGSAYVGFAGGDLA